jgi:hypothetical protein
MTNLKCLKGSGSGLVEVLSRHFLERLRKSTKISVKISGVPVELGTENLPNESLERYQYTSRYGVYYYRCSYAGNVVGKNLDIFPVRAVSIFHIL